MTLLVRGRRLGSRGSCRGSRSRRSRGGLLLLGLRAEGIIVQRSAGSTHACSRLGRRNLWHVQRRRLGGSGLCRCSRRGGVGGLGRSVGSRSAGGWCLSRGSGWWDGCCGACRLGGCEERSLAEVDIEAASDQDLLCVAFFTSASAATSSLLASP